MGWVNLDLLEVYTAVCLAGSVSNSMRKGIINLIYKQKGENDDIRN